MMNTVDHDVAGDFLECARAVHFFRLSADSTISRCNAAAAENLQLPREQIVGHSICEFLTEPDARLLLQELRVAGRRSQPLLLNLCGSDHSPYTLECWLDIEESGGATLVGEPPLRRDQRQHRQMLEVSHELALLSRERARLIDAERRARLAAEAANREKDRAIATIAHELRQPLQPMRFALQLLKSEAPALSRERARERLERQLTHLTRLVEDLLDAARLRENKLQLNRATIDLRDVLRDVSSDAGTKAASAGLELQSVLPPTPLWVHADSTRLRQVFSNLLDNAIKYSRPTGRVALTACLEGSTTAISVRDTGRGIAPETLPRLFQMFGQAQEGERGGLGIGLAVAHGLVALHGGRIEVTSAGIGTGAEFVVRLPVQENVADLEIS